MGSGKNSFFRYWRQAGTGILLAASFLSSAWSAQFTSLHVTPSEEYTRVTIEHEGKLPTRHFVLTAPHRVVVEMTGLANMADLRAAVAALSGSDPRIRQIRIGQTENHNIRLVIEASEALVPQILSLEGADRKKRRLVIDLRPTTPDPIARLLRKQQLAQNGPSEKAKAPPSATADAYADAEEDPAASPAPAKKSRADKPGKKQAKSGVKFRLPRVMTVVIDPGHGGQDSGAVGYRGTKEKHIVLSIARKLKEKIESESNMRVVMTRDGDYFVPLAERVNKARKAKADLFISVHADAFIEARANGSSVFALSEKGASSASARWLARRENESDLIGGGNIKTHNKQLASVLLDMSTSAQIKDSLKLGDAVLREISGINRLHKNHVEQAGFAVLKAPDIPSILVETAFLSNPKEEGRLNSRQNQDDMANAIFNGIRRYFTKKPAEAPEEPAGNVL
ncbi:MAG: N-acetylmuramoyl-L-alanine amidase [Burkholderiaceae bacterium]|jgi:N-acetylmuramoyl-L-alanine amidase|nr:N-acetylmuramoyl-L-alanine amidase [Burkholderiaceae bacterium]